MKRARVWAILSVAGLWLSASFQSAAGGEGFEGLTLRLSSVTPRLLPMQPLQISIRLSNETEQDITTHSQIAPNQGYLELRVASGDGAYERFRTADWPVASGGGPERPMRPGDFVERRGHLYFGWDRAGEKAKPRYLTPEPGTYRIKAVLRDMENRTIESEAMVITAEEPVGIERKAYEFIKEVTEPMCLMDGLVGSRREQLIAAKQEEFLSKYPSSRYAVYMYLNLGITYRDAVGKGEEAGMALLEKAGACDPPYLAQQALVLLVDRALRAGKTERAVQYLGTFTERFPDSPGAKACRSTIEKAVGRPIELPAPRATKNEEVKTDT
jgi:hypothetical protein